MDRLSVLAWRVQSALPQSRLGTDVLNSHIAPLDEFDPLTR